MGTSRMKTNFNFFFWAIALAGSIVGLNRGLAGQAQAAPASVPVQMQNPILAQAASADYAPRGCRVTRDRVGIYAEPNNLEESRGLLEKDVTVLLGSGSGPGWARIVAPETGWIQSKFLRGNANTVCPPGFEASFENSGEGSGENSGASPVTPRRGRTIDDLPRPVTPPILSRPPRPVIQQPANIQVPPSSGSVARVTRSLCEVIPEEGLIVRDTPTTVSSRVIGNIQAGRYTFQFSDRRLELETPEGLRQWVYITAPAKGWISTGFVNGGSNLLGEGCQ